MDAFVTGIALSVGMADWTPPRSYPLYYYICISSATRANSSLCEAHPLEIGIMATEPKPPIQYYDLPNFRFEDGTVVPVARLAYLDINPTAPRVALVPTCFRGTLHSTLNFAAGALRHHRVIVVALFGNGESSSPSHAAPRPDGPAPDFPAALDYRDCVRAQHALLTAHLGVRTVDVVLGFSMGGQCAYYWAAAHPARVRRAVVICSAARTSAHNRQFLEGPRAALENAVDYADVGPRAPSHRAPRGLRAFAKAYSAWLTSAAWFDQEGWRALGYASHAAWDEDATGPRYDGCYPNDMLASLRMWQAGDVGVCRTGSAAAAAAAADPPAQTLAEALAPIEAPVLLMPSQTDQYFRWEASEREAQLLKHGVLEIIPSIWGHLAGMGADKEALAWMDEKIEKFLHDTEAITNA